MSTDTIRKEILLRASAARVWRALSDAGEFGRWFGVQFKEAFQPGAKVTGILTGTETDPEVRKLQEPHAGKKFEITIEKMEPERLFSFRWHPHAMDPAVDYSEEPSTLVEFALEEAAGGVKLTLTESGFDQIPLGRRATAFSANDGGWTIMTKVFGDYVARAT
jgi:uncharacterized protein YndB with AHSA1/START domain